MQKGSCHICQYDNTFVFGKCFVSQRTVLPHDSADNNDNNNNNKIIITIIIIIITIIFAALLSEGKTLRPYVKHKTTLYKFFF